jgi:uncharacterized protein YqfA (UPF0365 family)
MSLKDRFPRITVPRVLVVVVFVVAIFVIFKAFGGNEWVSGITAGLPVAFGSIIGTRWRNVDGRRGNNERP